MPSPLEIGNPRFKQFLELVEAGEHQSIKMTRHEIAAAIDVPFGTITRFIARARDLGLIEILVNPPARFGEGREANTLHLLVSLETYQERAAASRKLKRRQYENARRKRRRSERNEYRERADRLDAAAAVALAQTIEQAGLDPALLAVEERVSVEVLGEGVGAVDAWLGGD